MNKSELKSNHLQRITSAMKEGLHQADWELVDIMRGGMSDACIYKINVNHKNYVIKLDNIERAKFNLVRCYHNLKIVSDAHIAPNVIYSNVENGVVLMDFINAVPFKFADKNFMQQLATTIRKLHDGKPFQSGMTIFDMLNFLYNKLPTEIKEHHIVKRCVTYSMELKATLSDPLDIKPSHGDLNPSNILYDGKQIYLVDWLQAMPQNLYFDLVCCQLFFYFHNDELSGIFIEQYFGRRPTTIELKKLYLMRIFTNCYYGIVFLAFPIMLGKEISILPDDKLISLPSFIDFMQGISMGKVNLADPITQQQFGFVFFHQAIHLINRDSHE